MLLLQQNAITETLYELNKEPVVIGKPTLILQSNKLPEVTATEVDCKTDLSYNDNDVIPVDYIKEQQLPSPESPQLITVTNNDSINDSDSALEQIDDIKVNLESFLFLIILIFVFIGKIFKSFNENC